MSFPDRNNPYLFDAFLQWRRKVDYYRDDPFFQRVVKHYTGADWTEVDLAVRRLSEKASFRWRDLAEAIAWPEKHPYVMHYDAYKHRIVRIVRPAEIATMEKEVFTEALFSKKTSPWVRLIKMFLIYQNGEACISCPVTCTEGLVELLNQFADTPELKHIREHCREGIEGNFAIGAQYLTEIQGGSDVPSNVVEAEEQQGIWRLYGSKFFCSATHADYAVVTAKPISLASAASMARAAREAQKYAEFRTASGREIHQFPMVANQVARLGKYAHRTVAGAFKLYQAFLRHQDKLSDKLDGSADSAEQKERFDIRELIMLQNILSGGDAKVIQMFAEEIEGLVAHPSLLEPDAETRKICERWDSLCHRLFHA